MTEKTALQILEETEAALRNKKQRKYFSVAGFSILLVHAFTHQMALLVIAVALLFMAILRHIQFRVFARRHATKDESHRGEPEVDEKTDHPLVQFNSNGVTALIKVAYHSKQYELSFEHQKEDWEGDDILLCKFSDVRTYLHPAAFFECLKSADVKYLRNKSETEIASLQEKPSLKFGYLEDSRDYPIFQVEGKNITVQCKYLCPIFHIIGERDGAVLVVDDLRDENGEEIPSIIATLAADVLEKSSAMYSKEEGVWVAT